MKVRTLLDSQIAYHDLCPGAVTIDEWLRKPWLEMRLEDKLVPIFPMWPIREALSKHDIHHALTGYSTNIEGEAELAAWELSSGGCALNFLFWVDRIVFCFIGLLTYPKSTFHAWRRGVRCRNLFGKNLNLILDTDVDEVRQYLRIAA